jgi:hypothetical protein
MTGVGLDQPALHLVGDLLVHDQAARGGAALAGGADRAEHDRGQREVEVRVVEDDRVVAAELQDRAPETAATLLGDGAADLRSSR